jgi:hypothetical protein
VIRAAVLEILILVLLPHSVLAASFPQHPPLGFVKLVGRRGPCEVIRTNNGASDRRQDFHRQLFE